MSGRDLTQRGVYQLWASDKLRFADVDSLGHVNNAVFATFCETGRIRFLEEECGFVGGPEGYFVIARLILDFRAELRPPGMVDIGIRVNGVGRSSFTLGHGLFKDDTCAATAEGIVVLVDRASGRSRLLPDTLRQRLAALAAA